MSDAVLRVTLSNNEKQLSSFEVRIQEGLSGGLVKRLVYELGGKKFKVALDQALSQLMPPRPQQGAK